jgi:outer membrane beta-barrel protein
MKTILTSAVALLFFAARPALAAEEAPPPPAAESVKAAEPAASATLEEKAPEASNPKAAEPSEPTPGAAGAQALVIEGAPLGNANVHVHIVEKKPYTNEGRHELALYPVIAQLNSKFTTHVGVAMMYGYHLFENLALQITPLFHYLNQESSFNQELIDKGRNQAQAATALLLQWGGVAGVEVTPMYGKFAFYQGTLGHFTFVLNAGAGMGSTRIQLHSDLNCGENADPSAECQKASFGDTGFKFVGSVGAGFRLFLGDRVAVRLEVRDLVYTARVDRINGCTYEDVEAIDAKGNPQSSGCKPSKFADSQDVNYAKLMLKQTSSDVLNNVSVYAGVSVLF